MRLVNSRSCHLLASVVLAAAPISRCLQAEGVYEFMSPYAAPYGRFGSAVAIAGDTDNDGHVDLIVGAPSEEFPPIPNQEGRAYVFNGATGDTIHVLVSPQPRDIGLFGCSVAGVGDLDGDGFDDVAVGAIGEGLYAYTGRVHTFSGATGDLLFTLDSPNPQMQGHFGHVVSTAGDVNDDGIPDLIVGAPVEDVSAELNSAGRAYLFDGSDGALLHVLLSPNSQNDGYFGCSVASVGDFGGDGLGDVAIGAFGESSSLGLQGAGRAYVFSGQTGAVINPLHSPSAQDNGWFGYSLDSAGDVDGDGISDIIIGAYGEDPALGPEDAGQAHVYSGPTCALIHTLSSPCGTDQGHFGFAVSRLGDVNSDGRDEVVVGAHREDAVSRPGHAYVFDGATGIPVFILRSPHEEFEGFFGCCVSGGDPDGDCHPEVLVGARREDPGTGLEDAGRAYLIRPELNLSAELAEATLVLDWTECIGAVEYLVYAASNCPHFSPGGPPGFEHLLLVLSPWETSLTSPLGVGDLTSNWTYLVVAAAESSQELARSNRVGEQDFCADVP